MARVGVELEVEDAPELLCFAGELCQVFVNLIANAVESMEHGGRITISVRPGTDWQTVIEVFGSPSPIPVPA